MSAEAEKAFARLAREFLKFPDVSLGHGKGGFGENALNVRGKIFAMLTSKGQFSVKLPRERVSSLVASGDGHPLTMANRQMKEWLVVSSKSTLSWKALAAEAHVFLAKGA